MTRLRLAPRAGSPCCLSVSVGDQLTAAMQMKKSQQSGRPGPAGWWRLRWIVAKVAFGEAGSGCQNKAGRLPLCSA